MAFDADIGAEERLIRRRYHRRGALVTAALFAIGLLMVWAAHSVAGSREERALRASLHEALALHSETLSGLLEKYRLLPPLLSRRADVVETFLAAGSGAATGAARDKAWEIAGYSGAKDVAFADREGRIFVSARGIFDNSKLNREALLDAALQGRLGRESISPDENERAYVFASAVRSGSSVIGVIAIYVNIERIELTWALSANPIAVTDSNGIVFVSNRPEWRLRPLFGDTAANPVVIGGSATSGDRVAPANGSDTRYLTARQSLPLMGWTLHVMADDAQIDQAARNAALIAFLASLLAASIAWYAVKRQETLAIRRHRAHADSVRLEHLVDERTADLVQANAALAREVKDRTEAEEQLRRTQSELVQAAKLAALGQMSATLSHEYNQPLAAIRTYADNATQLLARGRADAATEALSRIGDLVGRMSELSRTLLSFARKPGTATSDVPLAPVVDEALMLAAPRARKAGIDVSVEAIDRDLAVRGGHIRLTQVVVNLVNNAIDALTGIGSDGSVRDPRIALRAEREGKQIKLTVEDNGPGIPPDAAARIFEPFYSTKGVGEGLGIGLSIVYNIVREFGGTVSVSRAESGGARITVSLLAADTTSKLAKAS